MEGVGTFKFGSGNEQLIEKLLLVAARVKLQSDFLECKLLGVGVKKLAPGIRFNCMIGQIGLGRECELLRFFIQKKYGRGVRPRVVNQSQRKVVAHLENRPKFPERTCHFVKLR